MTFLSQRTVCNIALLACGLVLPLRAAQAQTATTPGNIDFGVRQLMRHQAEPGFSMSQLRHGTASLDRQTGHPSATVSAQVTVDAQNRVTVYVYLNGSKEPESVAAEIAAAGGVIQSRMDSVGRGAFAARLPLDQIAALAGSAGVRSITLAPHAHQKVGATTSQGAVQLRSVAANRQGFTGRGVTVGILSDSWDTSSGFGVTDTAETDVMTGDLPEVDNIAGGAGLKYLNELDPMIFGPGTDEGRAMGQIIHDVAPRADLCFATGVEDKLTFAAHATDLRVNSACAADVIVDDIEFEDEPFFSDGLLARTLDKLATDSSLPGHPVSVVSAGGNEAQEGYASTLHIISNAHARALAPSSTRVNLSTIPTTIDTSGGFHNFGNDDMQIFEDIAFVDGTDISFQWDDPFNSEPSGITTDLNLLFFDPVSGNFQFAVDDDNFATNQPLELFTLHTGNGPGTTSELLMVIARTGKGLHLANQIKYVAFGGIFDLNGLITSRTPLTFGHSAANSVTSVGAVVYTADPLISGPPHFDPQYETFSSPGPVLIAFGKDGSRLTDPEIRLKPDLSGPDGVNTTFFPEEVLFGPGLDYEAGFGVPDGFPNFFGTSAAAPHIAGIEALMLQKAGGPGSLPPPLINSILKLSAPPRDRNVLVSEAFGSSTVNSIHLRASGLASGALGINTSFVTVSFKPITDSQLTSLTLDLNGTGLLFDQTKPFQLAPAATVSVSSATLSADHHRLTITLNGASRNSVFGLGLNVYFANVKGQPAKSASAASADELVPATFRAEAANAKGERQTVGGSFSNVIGLGYSIYDGFGMPDALNALALTPLY